MEYNIYKRTDLPLERYLRRVPEDRKKILHKRLRIILNKLGKLSPSLQEGVPSIDECLRLLGSHQVRRDMIIETNKLIMETVTNYSYILPWAKELRQLCDAMNEQIKLLNQMIRAILFEQEKDEGGSNEEAPRS